MQTLSARQVVFCYISTIVIYRMLCDAANKSNGFLVKLPSFIKQVKVTQIILFSLSSTFASHENGNASRIRETL